jgi:GntR family transcriptional regulator, transcriptional repressor for pyruvate dehydrogenase complex
MPQPASKLTSTTRPLRPGALRLSDRLADDLEAQILRGDITTGELLPSEADLCSTFGVSRTVVRDALRTLDARGLVESVPGRGTTVRAPDEEALSLAVLTRLMRSDLSLLDVVRARAAIDVNLVPLAAENANDTQIAAVREAFDEFAAGARRRRWRDTHAAHTRFHIRLLDAIGVPALRVILAPVQQIIMLGALPFAVNSNARWAAEVPLHQEIVEALEARSTADLRSSLERHYAWVAAYPEAPATVFRNIPAVEDLVDSRAYRLREGAE